MVASIALLVHEGSGSLVYGAATTGGDGGASDRSDPDPEYGMMWVVIW
jgi:hypothetical protein